MTSIALARGFDPEQLWQHDGNAELRELRHSPNALLPGDQLEVPPLEEREEGVATGSIGRFQLKVGPVKLRLRLLHWGEPRADEPYELQFPDGATLTGSTDGDGWIDQPIPAAATTLTLSLRDGEETHELQIGHLDPHDSPTGIQQRLRALGHYFGAIDGELGRKTEGAVRRFQADQGLAVTGEADDATANALRDAYGH